MAKLSLRVVKGTFAGDAWNDFKSIIEVDKFIHITRHEHQAPGLVKPGTMEIWKVNKKSAKKVGER